MRPVHASRWQRWRDTLLTTTRLCVELPKIIPNWWNKRKLIRRRSSERIAVPRKMRLTKLFWLKPLPKSSVSPSISLGEERSSGAGSVSRSPSITLRCLAKRIEGMASVGDLLRLPIDGPTVKVNYIRDDSEEL